MSLLQKAPRTPDEAARGRPLRLDPSAVDALDEDAWQAQAFRGEDAPQLTVRALLVGSALGFVLAATNLYIGLKTGLAVPVALTACVVSFALSLFLVRIGVARTTLTILETNCMQSTASSAGYATGAVMVTAIPALLVLSATPAHPQGVHMPWAVLSLWTLLTGALGVCLALPVKRPLIDRERLRFPSGMASAATLHAFYSEGSEALRRARALLLAGLWAMVPPFLFDLQVRRSADERAPLLSGEARVFDWLPARGQAPDGTPYLLSDWTAVLDFRMAMLGVGVLTGLRVAASILLGALLLMFVVGPAGLAAGAATSPSSAWKEIGVWVGAPMIVSAGLAGFLLSSNGVFRRALHRTRGPKAPSSIEVPRSWFVVGTFVAGLGIIVLAHQHFAIPAPYGVLALGLTVVMSVVACRATGETDMNPIAPMGKIMQLVYGLLLPQNPTANLMTAAITVNAGYASGDLLTDLKAGRLLGAHPRRQFAAQMFGVLAGTAGTVIAFYLLVPDATALTGVGNHPPAFPAPAMQQWLTVAKLMSSGLHALSPLARQMLFVGAAVGVALAAVDRFAPRAARFVPSAIGLGCGFILPFQYPLSMFIGAAAAAIVARRSPAAAERYNLVTASGLVAGESLAGLIVAALNNLR